MRIELWGQSCILSPFGHDKKKINRFILVKLSILEESPLGNAALLLFPLLKRAVKINQLGLSTEPAGRVPSCHFSTKKD